MTVAMYMVMLARALTGDGKVTLHLTSSPVFQLARRNLVCAASRAKVCVSDITATQCCYFMSYSNFLRFQCMRC